MADKQIDMKDALPETFEPFIGETFRAFNEGSESNVRLVAVSVTGGPIPGLREKPSFRLTFMTDHIPETPYSVKVTLQNDAFGTMENLTITPNAGMADPAWGEGQHWSANFG